MILCYDEVEKVYYEGCDAARESLFDNPYDFPYQEEKHRIWAQGFSYMRRLIINKIRSN